MLSMTLVACGAQKAGTSSTATVESVPVIGNSVEKGVTGAEPVISEKSPRAPKTGRVAFTEYGCVLCHNYQGRGGGAGPRLAVDRLPIEAFSQIVRTPYGVMPAYPESQLPQSKWELIHAYLESLPATPDTIDSALLYDTSE